MKRRSMIKKILEFKDIFSETPQSVDYYLSNILYSTLIEKACLFCQIADCHEIYDTSNLLWSFFDSNDKKHTDQISQKLNQIFATDNTHYTIINTRASLLFFEYAYRKSKIDLNADNESLSHLNMFKAYLVINEIDGEIESLDKDTPIEELLLVSEVKHGLYRQDMPSLIKIHLAQYIKSHILFKYLEEKYPIHLDEFLKFYKVSSWKEYILWLHQIAMLVIDKSDKENIATAIILNENDEKYKLKHDFLKKFCIELTGDNDEDFSEIKNHPIIQIDKNTFGVISSQFLSEKMYKSVYFSLKGINKALVDTDFYVNENDFRKDYGYNFTEKTLLGCVLKASFGRRYKHLDYSKLTSQGDPDYYIRNGNKIFLFECKDNLINKSIIESVSHAKLIDELANIFIEKHNRKKNKPGAIKQISNNIQRLLNNSFSDDIKVNNVTIYPLIVVNHDIYSLPGVNKLINVWFKNELAQRGVNNSQIRPLIIIDMNTLVLSMDLFKDKIIKLDTILDKYINIEKTLSEKRYSTENDVINAIPLKYQSFKDFMNDILEENDYIRKELHKYNDITIK